jgi:cytochrome oxidase Cu insertion factor (SCO1/SenC/PrrC family)
MSLQARLDRIREGFEKEAPAEALAIMHRATDDLRASGIMDGVVGEGQSAPDFTLEDSRGQSTTLSDLRAKGPVVLTFFRGDW